jgi:hypothetical protein
MGQGARPGYKAVRANGLDAGRNDLQTPPGSGQGESMKFKVLVGTVTLFAVLLAGCGGMPKPEIQAVTPRADHSLVRVSMSATNYGEAWDAENPRLRCEQVWLNRQGVQIEKTQVFEQPFNGRQGDRRSMIRLQNAEGKPDRWIRLYFEIVSGESAARENITAGTTVEYKVPSEFVRKDLLFLPVLSRKAGNSYAIDVLYIVDPQTGQTEQLLPHSSER